MRSLIAACLIVAAPAWAQTDPGQALFLQGEGASAVLFGGLRMSGPQIACAGCHGADARGDAEGATVFPPIDWASLSRGDRAGGPYDRAAFAAALRDGLAPDGRRLADAMPRYEITDEAIDGLVGFLQRIDADQRRGVGPRSIHISASAGGDALRGLSLAADRFNREGGAFGRSLTMGPRETSLLDEEDLGRILDLRLERAGIKPVLRPALHLSPARADTHPRTLRAYFHGLVLGQALIECGRDVTRHCIEDHARKLRLSMFLDLP